MIGKRIKFYSYYDEVRHEIEGWIMDSTLDRGSTRYLVKIDAPGMEYHEGIHILPPENILTIY